MDNYHGLGGRKKIMMKNKEKITKERKIDRTCFHKETGAIGIIWGELEADEKGRFPAQFGIHWMIDANYGNHYTWNDKDKIEEIIK